MISSDHNRQSLPPILLHFRPAFTNLNTLISRYTRIYPVLYQLIILISFNVFVLGEWFKKGSISCSLLCSPTFLVSSFFRSGVSLFYSGALFLLLLFITINPEEKQLSRLQTAIPVNKHLHIIIRTFFLWISIVIKVQSGCCVKLSVLLMDFSPLAWSHPLNPRTAAELSRNFKDQKVPHFFVLCINGFISGLLTNTCFHWNSTKSKIMSSLLNETEVSHLIKERNVSKN